MSSNDDRVPAETPLGGSIFSRREYIFRATSPQSVTLPLPFSGSTSLPPQRNWPRHPPSYSFPPSCHFFLFFLAMRSFAPALAVLSLPLFALAAYHGRHPRGHVGLAARARGDVLDKRDFSGRFTYYDITVGLYVPLHCPHFPCLIIFYSTACGGSFSASDYVSDQCNPCITKPSSFLSLIPRSSH